MKKAFDVYFSGELLEGYEPDAVKASVGELFGLSGPKLEALFSGVPVRIKKNLDVDRAGRFRKKFLELGALVQIVPAGQEPPAPASSASRPAAKAPAATALPGSEEPASTGLSLAPQAPLESEPAGEKAAAIDTSGLSMSAPGADILPSDGKPERETPLPDISGLSLAPLNEKRTPEGEATDPPPPDIGHLELAPMNGGDPVPPEKERTPPLPDISGLSLEE